MNGVRLLYLYCLKKESILLLAFNEIYTMRNGIVRHGPGRKLRRAKRKAQSASKKKQLPNRPVPFSVEILSNPTLID